MNLEQNDNDILEEGSLQTEKPTEIVRYWGKLVKTKWIWKEVVLYCLYKKDSKKNYYLKDFQNWNICLFHSPVQNVTITWLDLSERCSEYSERQHQIFELWSQPGTHSVPTSDEQSTNVELCLQEIYENVITTHNAIGPKVWALSCKRLSLHFCIFYDDSCSQRD